MAKLFANSGDPDQTPHSAASDLGLHCLPITLLRVSRLQWVKLDKKKKEKKASEWNYRQGKPTGKKTIKTSDSWRLPTIQCINIFNPCPAEPGHTLHM